MKDWGAWAVLGLIMALLLYFAGGCAQPATRGISPLPQPTATAYTYYWPIVFRQMPATATPTRMLTPTATRTVTATATRTATSAPTVTPTPTATTGGVSDEAQRIVTAVNVARAALGLEPLTIEPRLMTVAQAHAEDMIRRDYFSHDTLDGPGWAKRVTALYTPWAWVAENIAGGSEVPEAVVARWLASPGHRANMLNERAVHVGVGYASGNAKHGTRWVMDLGEPGN